MLETQAELGIILAVLFIFSIISFYKKFLNKKGIFVANIVGFATFFLGGIVAFFTLLIFYVVSELATQLGRRENEKHEKRTTSNIIGNAGSAIIALLLGSVPGFFGAMAAALSDTTSSEIGMLSKNKPVLITTFKRVEKGTDGGITALGILAGGFFSALIGLVYYFFVQQSLLVFGAIALSGLLGSIVDSLLGAIFELKGKLNNTQVNFIASGSGALLTFLIISII